MKKKKIIRFTKSEIYLILIIFFMEIVMVGMAGNFKVIQNNGGKMPVESDMEYISDKHFTFQNRSEIPYYYLADIYYGPNYIYSIGDLIMFFGAAGSLYFLWLFTQLKRFEFKRNNKIKKRKKKKCK